MLGMHHNGKHTKELISRNITKISIVSLICVIISSSFYISYNIFNHYNVAEDDKNLEIMKIFLPLDSFASDQKIFHKLDAMKLEENVHQLANEKRREQGIEELGMNGHLRDIARSHSADMSINDYFAHSDLNGHDPTDRAEAMQFRCRINLPDGRYIASIGENMWLGWSYAYKINGVPAGYYAQEEVAEEIVNGWMNSAGHRQNMLSSFWETEGIGIYITEDDKIYVTQDFC
jgi:uncharacterized protein YkwD